MSSLFDRPNFQFKKKRSVSASETLFKEDKDKPEAEQKQKIPTKDLIQKVLNKADSLEEAINKALIEKSIPVDQSNTEVVSSVKRLDPISRGKYITKELYLNSLSYLKIYRELTPEKVSGAIKLSSADQQNEIKKLFDNRNKNDIARSLIGSQLLYLFTLQSMQAGFQALQGMKATLLPNAPEAATELAASIAFIVSYTNSSIEDIKALIKEITNKDSKINIDAVIEKSKEIDPTENIFFNTLIEAKKDTDQRIIVEYVHNFLATTRDIGYEPWFFLYDLYEIKEDLKSNLKTITEDKKTFTGTELEKLFRKRSLVYSRTLNSIATALSETETSSLTICSLEFLFGIPDNFLNMFKSIYELGISLQSVDLSVVFPEVSIKGLLWQILEDALRYLYNVVENILCWFSGDPEIWNILYECPSIAELIDAALSVISKLKQKILDLFENVIDELRKRERFLTYKAQLVYESYRMKVIVNKYNAVLTSIKHNLRTAATIKKDIESIPKKLESIKNRIEIELKDKAESIEDFVRSEFKDSFVISGVDTTPLPSTLPIPRICYK